MRKRIQKIRGVIGCSVLAVSIFTTSVIGFAASPVSVREIASTSSSEVAVGVQTPVFKVSDEIPLGKSLQIELQTMCGDNAVPYEIALAVIYQESRFDPDARNGDCIGYMQVNKINLEWLHKEIGITDLSNPVQNLMAGTYMLGELFEKYGEWNMVLTAYNFGESGAHKNFFSKGKISCPYSDAVMVQYKVWKKILEENE